MAQIKNHIKEVNDLAFIIEYNERELRKRKYLSPLEIATLNWHKEIHQAKVEYIEKLKALLLQFKELDR